MHESGVLEDAQPANTPGLGPYLDCVIFVYFFCRLMSKFQIIYVFNLRLNQILHVRYEDLKQIQLNATSSGIDFNSTISY